MSLWGLGRLLGEGSVATALLFYLPSPLVVAAGVILAAPSLRWRQWKRAVLLLGLTLPAVISILVFENSWHRPGGNPEGESTWLRVVHWNVANNPFGWKHTETRLRRMEADFHLLSEMSRLEHFLAAAESLGSEVQSLRLGSMIALARGRLESAGWLVNTVPLKAHLLLWTPEEIDREAAAARTIRILAVDTASDPLLPRGPVFARLQAILATEKPDLVLGDFNTPRRSRWLHPPPAGYRHAYWVAGSGWSYSWPAVMPMIAIDHCLIKEGLIKEGLSKDNQGKNELTLRRYRLLNTLSSDHRPQVLDLARAR